MRNRICKQFYSICTGIVFTLFFISLGLIIAIHWRGLYYHDIDALNIPQTSGISKEIIRENYDALIDYCSPFFDGQLSFPSLPSSESGLSHFAEVKVIFVAFHYIFAFTLLLLIPLLLIGRRLKYYSLLMVTSITTVILPTIVGLACMLNFDQAFVIFHKIFFRNDDWLFDPRLDPVILILPSEFFLHCALVIIATVLFGALLQFISYCIVRRKLNR